MKRKAVLGLAAEVDKKTRGIVKIKKQGRKKLAALVFLVGLSLPQLLDTIPDMVDLVA